MPFDGATYQREFDFNRLSNQLQRVFNLMSDNEWRTLEEISYETGGSQASVSARLRDLRKSKFGNHTINRRRLNGGLFQYQLKENS